MVDVGHIGSFANENPEAGRGGETRVIEHPLDTRTVMAGIERHAEDIYTVDSLALEKPDPVAVIYLAARIVGETGEDLHIVSLTHELLGEKESLKCWLRVKPLSNQEDAQGTHGSFRYSFEVWR
jgi:hypothetical protein